MAALDQHQDPRHQQASRTGFNMVRQSSNPEVNWQTPVMSAKFQARFPRGEGTAGGRDAAMGVTRPDHTDEFCNSSGSSSFQPIRSHITIPTAHVMPSTQGSSPGTPHLRGGYSPGPVGNSTASTPGMSQAGEGGLAASSKVLSIEVPPKTGEYGFENSVFPGLDHGREENRKFDIPNIEPTLNQSALLDTFCSDPRLRFQLYNQAAVPTETGREPYRSLPETRPAPNSNTEGPSQPSRSTSMPMGFQQSSVYSKQSAPSTHVWRQEPYPLQLDRASERGLWQQQQQLDSMQVQVAQLQLMNGAACHQPSVYGAAVHRSMEPGHWESLLKSSETLLKDKDLLVEWQRQHIAQLEQKMRESELQVHSALLGRPAPYGDIYVLRLQEVQRENTFLRAQFAEQYEAFRKEKAEQEQKLGALEANSKAFHDTLKEATQKHAEELKKQEERVKGRDKHMNTLKKKCQKESEQSRERQQRIETLERYLAGLPTQEDHQKQSQQLKEMGLKSADLQETVTELERSLGEARAACRERDAQLETEKRRGLELLATVHSLQEKADECLKNVGGAEQAPHEMDDVKQENQGLKKEQEYLKKIVDSQKRKIDQLCSQVKSLQEQVAQEEGTDQALNEESRRRDAAVQQLGRAVKELSLQNQDLIERNLLLQEQLRQLEPSTVPSGDPSRILLQLYQDLVWCLQDLQSVCSVLTQQAQGKDPNLSLLLGIHSVPPDMDEGENWQNPEVLARKVAEVKQLHKDIEDLRTAMSDRYAQDMGDNCVTQ